ncbi:beta-galactosidase [Actinomadura kijaniata]|uniref:Beta-galactosidase n=1 Tax=Actinomadura namibiensis TaxID=182080 RepID=A0A7W3LWV0_ACTNM|nr:beta-galactosidase [Actinomadura namibiensis]MBA8955793.1 beta-galactosidase [Actinomadura namibiensis]
MSTEGTRVLSGAMHYFRTLPPQWPQRLAALRAMGLDTVETYVPWNLHEPRPGEYVFTGLADVEGFLRAAADAGLRAIVRPGPYICAEWDNGGLPAWLRADGEIPLRCMDRRYLDAVDRWFDVLIPRLVPHLATRGGNVIMMQVENEYGSYGSDRAYLAHLRDGLRARGVDVPLFTSDGGTDLMLTGGTVPGVPATTNFGSGAAGEFAALRRHRPDDPLFCMEFWCGWFGQWGRPAVTRPAADAAAALAEVLAAGASVNVYMAHGGTSFGFHAGANADGDLHDGAYRPQTTSYDYDAPLDERGAPTAKYRAFREVLSRHAVAPPPEPPPPAPTLPPASLPVTDTVRLLDCLPELTARTVETAVPPTFEELGQAYGLAVYRATLPGPRPELPLSVRGLRDRAHLLVDGEPRAVLERDGRTGAPVAVPGGGAEVTLVVEAMGRINYGPLLGERKGVTGGVLHERQYVHDWRTASVPLDDIARVPWGRARRSAGPAFHRAWLEVAAPADAFVALPGWGKGYVWVNGFCLGRHWEAAGPQRALYLPWPLLAPGRNEIVVLELDEPAAPVPGRRVEVRDRPGEAR